MTTALTMTRTSLRQIAAVIAIVMVFASMPTIGVVLIPDQSGPSLTLDICHPLQSLDRTPVTVVVARPAPPSVAPVALSRETECPRDLVFEGIGPEEPDHPPPRAIA